MIETIIDYEPYILNDNNMSLYLKYKLNNKPFDKCFHDNDNSHHKSALNVKNKKQLVKENYKQSIFFPKEQDSLFWCYYIITCGEYDYECLNNKNTLVAKQIKINYINKIRENKLVLKKYKFDTISNIESNLVNDNNINIKTFMALSTIDKINIIFVTEKTYYELLINDTENIYLIRERDNKSKYSKKYGFEIAKQDVLKKIRSELYKIESFAKPIKSISNYKVQDLIDICNKLRIEIKCKDSDKNKTKQELYESIIKYL